MNYSTEREVVDEQLEICRLKSRVERLEKENSILSQRHVLQQFDETNALSEMVDYSACRKGHFELAEKMLAKQCKHIFLMQRSSSLVLGGEKGWQGEKRFHDALIKQIRTGVKFSHVVSVDDIVGHLQRKGSQFPGIISALNQLESIDGVIHITGAGYKYCLKRMPAAGQDPLFKPDRQARTVLAQFEDGTFEGVLVSDLGTRQGWFTLRGPKVEKFLDACYQFYKECECLTKFDIDRIKQAIPPPRGV